MGRPNEIKGAWTPAKVRARIRTGALLRRLSDHVFGRVDMTVTQITAVKVLLAKTLPDLKAIDHTLSDGMSRPNELTDAQLADIATGSRPGAIEQAPGSQKLN